MPPDTIVPYPWVVDSDHVLDGFEATYDGGYNLRAVPTPIAHECSEHVYLLDDGSRYLLWYRISDEMAEIIKPVKLGDIMDAFAHDEVESKRVEASWEKDGRSGRETRSLLA